MYIYFHLFESILKVGSVCRVQDLAYVDGNDQGVLATRRLRLVQNF